MSDSVVKFAKAFQKLKSDIATTPSPDNKIILLVNFWKYLEAYKANPSYKTYFDEYVPILMHLIPKSNLDDLTIDELTELKNILDDLKPNYNAQVESSLVRVTSDLAKKYFYVGEIEKGLSIHCSGAPPARDKQGGPSACGGIFDDPSISEFETFHRLVELAREKSPELHALLQPILIEWEKIIETVDHGGAFCLFVEKNGDDISSRGRMKTLEGKVEFASKSSTTDDIAFNNQVIAPDDPFIGVSYTALEAVRNRFKKSRFEEKGNKYYHAHLHISDEISTKKESSPREASRSGMSPNRTSPFTGDSVGLAVALLSYIQLLKTEISRQDKYLSSDVAITGSIDTEGNILPVNKKTLSIKIERAFFSPVRYLLIPDGNLATAKEILIKLIKKYPRRYLKIIAIKHLSDAISDRNIIRTERVCPGVIIKKTITKYARSTYIQIPLLLVVLYFLLCLIYPKVWIGFDWNPYKVEIQHDRIVATNLNHDYLWDIDVYNKYSEYIDTTTSSVNLFNLDRDNMREGILLITPDYAKSKNGCCAFILFDHNGDILWDSLFSESIHIGNDTATNKYVFRYQDTWNKFREIRTDNGEEIKFITSKHHETGAFCQILCIDPINYTVNEYRHIGTITDWGVFDLYGDGIDDLIFTGLSMQHKCPVVIAFESFNLNGEMPVIGEDKMSNYNQEFYLLLPKTKIATIEQPDLQQADIASEDSSIILIHTCETRDECAGLIYEFDNLFDNINIYPTDAYLNYINAYWGKNRQLDRSELLRIPEKSEIRYFNGHEFLNTWATSSKKLLNK